MNSPSALPQIASLFFFMTLICVAAAAAFDHVAGILRVLGKAF